MSLKASSLKHNEAQQTAINREITAILERIDDELRLTHEQGQTYAVVSLPITFAIPYMKNSDAQRIIYYGVLTSLLDREFHPKIIMSSDRTHFCISWLSEEERNEIEDQNALLAKYSEKKTKAKAETEKYEDLS